MGSGKRRRERAKRSAKRSWNRDFSLPERSSKRYQTYFFIRASHASNKRERGYFLDRFDTIQIPDVLRIVPRRRAGTRITNNHATKKRTVFKDEARRRGLKTKIHEMILFTRAEMVAMLASATAEGERFVEQGDLREAAKLEMRYALSQGIIEKKPTLEDTYLTLKCWFLFSASPEFAGCTLTLNREEFWGDVVDIALRGHAAVSVVDIFKDSGHQLIACEWAKGILQELVNVDVPMAAHFFLKPMFGCDDEGPGSEEGGVDISKATGADVAWPEICVDGPPIQSRITVRAHDSVAAKVACVVAKLSVTTDGDEPYENVDLMIEVIRECLRSWDRKCVVEYEPVPADGPEYDADLVWKAFELFASHSKMRAYANKVKKSWQVPEEPSDDDWREEMDDDDEPHLPTVPEPPGREERASAPASDEAHGRHSSKKYVGELVDWCEKTAPGELPQELKDLQTFGFFTVQVFPLWYIVLVEHLVKSVKGRIFVGLFGRQSRIKVERWDEYRAMNTIMEGDLLHRLITSPLVKMMRGLGLLNVVESEEKRVVDVCAALLSRPRVEDQSTLLSTLGLQGMHADMDAWFKWFHKFGFSTITAGRRLAHLDIYPGSWDGGRGVAREPVRVDLPPGCSIVFHGLARHRGVRYPYESVRLFVSFVVKSVLEESMETDVVQTTALEKHRFQEPPALPLDEWKKFYMCRLT